jgi:HNH endonuclease
MPSGVYGFRAKPCTVHGCGLSNHGYGLCEKHYAEKKRRDAGVGPKKDKPICSVSGCGMPHKGHSFCQKHLQEKKRRELSVPIRRERAACAIEGCLRAAHAAGYCVRHYSNFYRTGDALTSKRAPNGTGHICKTHGYVIVYDKATKRQRGQHRLVMEDFLKRSLLPGESVHHINGIKTDNRLENLELWSTSQPYGQRVEDKVKWAKEILALYDKD